MIAWYFVENQTRFSSCDIVTHWSIYSLQIGLNMIFQCNALDIYGIIHIVRLIQI